MNRDDRPDPGSPARAEALLAATNRFLVAADVSDLVRTITDVTGVIFRPWKALVTLVGADGVAQVAGSAGYRPDEVARIQTVLEAAGPLTRRAMAGEELWSDDPGAEELRERIAFYGARSGFTLPIVTRTGVAGSLSAIYRDERGFDPTFREAARSLCAQAALALQLIATRDELRRNADALARQTRLSSALFAVSQELASVNDPAAIPAALARAILAATGASYSIVGRWDATAGRIQFVAAEGFGPEDRPLLEAVDASPERFRMIRGGLEGRASVRVPPFDPADVPLELVESLGVSAIAGAAVVVDGQPWGIIAVATTGGDPSIVESGADLLAGLASIAASAIGRAEATAALARHSSVLESAITERTIQLREAVDELRLASQAKTELLANVSHELRTPLTAILGFSDVLLQGLDGPLNPEQADDIATIDRSGRHLLELIDDLIDVAKIEAGRVGLQPEPLSLDDLLRGAVEEMRPLAVQKDLELTVATERLPTTITGDRSRLHEVLLNLIGNAVKFTSPGGRVEVRARGDGETVTVDVIDTGIGIPADQQASVFEKFRRLAGPEYPGTGLGLAIATEFARLHGGELTVDSVLGEGSTFTLRLPIRRPIGEADAGPHADTTGA